MKQLMREQFERELEQIEEKRRERQYVHDQALALGFSEAEAWKLQTRYDDRVFWRKLAGIALAEVGVILLIFEIARVFWH